MRERARERLAGHRSDSTARMLSSQGGRGVQAGACGTNAACTADGSRDRPRTSISLSPVVALDAVVATSTLKGGPRTAVDVWSPDAKTLFYRYFTTKLLHTRTCRRSGTRAWCCDVCSESGVRDLFLSARGALICVPPICALTPRAFIIPQATASKGGCQVRFLWRVWTCSGPACHGALPSELHGIRRIERDQPTVLALPLGLWVVRADAASSAPRRPAPALLTCSQRAGATGRAHPA